jgi:hypothetical protein
MRSGAGSPRCALADNVAMGPQIVKPGTPEHRAESAHELQWRTKPAIRIERWSARTGARGPLDGDTLRA